MGRSQSAASTALAAGTGFAGAGGNKPGLVGVATFGVPRDSPPGTNAFQVPVSTCSASIDQAGNLLCCGSGAFSTPQPGVGAPGLATGGEADGLGNGAANTGLLLPVIVPEGLREPQSVIGFKFPVEVVTPPAVAGALLAQTSFAGVEAAGIGIGIGMGVGVWAG